MIKDMFGNESISFDLIKAEKDRLHKLIKDKEWFVSINFSFLSVGKGLMLLVKDVNRQEVYDYLLKEEIKVPISINMVAYELN